MRKEYGASDRLKLEGDSTVFCGRLRQNKRGGCFTLAVIIFILISNSSVTSQILLLQGRFKVADDLALLTTSSLVGSCPPLIH